MKADSGRNETLYSLFISWRIETSAQRTSCCPRRRARWRFDTARSALTVVAAKDRIFLTTTALSAAQTTDKEDSNARGYDNGWQDAVCQPSMHCLLLKRLWSHAFMIPSKALVSDQNGIRATHSRLDASQNQQPPGGNRGKQLDCTDHEDRTSFDLCEAHWRWREIAAKCLNSTVQFPLIELAGARKTSRSIGEKPIRFIKVVKRPRLFQEKTYCAAVMSCQEPTSPAFSGV